MFSCTKQSKTVLLALSAVFFLTSLTPSVSAQTADDPDGPAPPKYADIGSNVCDADGWNDVRDDPDIARACLTLIGVNDGAGAYAFAKKAVGYDPDNPAGGGPEEAGLVSRWAMAEALTRTIETAAENPLLPPSAEAEAFFTDIGWLTADTRKRIAQLYDLEVTKGTSEAGVYDPAGPVTRGQMALFFVRTLSVIEALSPEEGLREFGNAEYKQESDTFSAVWEKETERIADGLKEAPADCRASVEFRERVLRTPFVDVCGWDNDDERFPAIKLIYDLGVTIGVSADSEGRRYYQAAEPVTGGQMALFLIRLLSHTYVRPPADTPAVGEVELPAGQQTDPVQIDGSRRPSDAVRVPQETLLTPDLSTRPPQEIDFYRYFFALNTKFRERHEQIGIYDGGQLTQASEPFSLQIGDWYWSRPPGEELRTLAVLIEFRAEDVYVQDYFPLSRAYFCFFPEGQSTDGALQPRTVLRVSPGVFRMTKQNLWIPPNDGCDMTALDVPVPADGYTSYYPCDNVGHFTNSMRSSAFSDNGITLPPCRT